MDGSKDPRRVIFLDDPYQENSDISIPFSMPEFHTTPVCSKGWNARIDLPYQFKMEWFEASRPSFFYWPNDEIFRYIIDRTSDHFLCFLEIQKSRDAINNHMMRLNVRMENRNDAILIKTSLNIDSYMLSKYK